MIGTFDEVDVAWMEGSDEPLSLDVDVEVVEQVDVEWLKHSDELLPFDNDVNAEDGCHKDVARLTDAAEMQQARLNDGDLDEPFCLDDDVLITEQVEVWMHDPDEPVCLGHDVEVDDSCDRDVV